MRTWIAAVVASMSVAGGALAHQPVKRDFLPDGLGFSENPLVEGRASFRYDACSGETDLKVRVDGLLPNTTYGVLWLSDGPTLDNPVAFTTDSCGEGHYDDYQIGDASGDPVVILYINVDDGDPDTFEQFDLGEERAFSYIPFTKIKDFHAEGAGLSESPCADGMATIRYHSDSSETRFHSVFHDLAANTLYGVYYTSVAGPSLDNPAAFTTNRRGTGKYNDFLVGVATRGVVMTLYRDDNNSGSYDPGEERASGASPQ